MLENACVETIWIRNHRVQGLTYHQARYEHTCAIFYRTKPIIKLSKIINRHGIDADDIKCRIIYNHQSIEVSYEVYQRRDIKSLQMVESPDISYPFKTIERPALDFLFSQKGNCDEIIITKNGYLTDAYYYSLVFENSQGLFVPKDALLPGTRRQALIESHKVKERRIHSKDLDKFTHVHLVNALNPLGKYRLEVKAVFQ